MQENLFDTNFVIHQRRNGIEEEKLERRKNVTTKKR